MSTPRKEFRRAYGYVRQGMPSMEHRDPIIPSRFLTTAFAARTLGRGLTTPTAPGSIFAYESGIRAALAGGMTLDARLSYVRTMADRRRRRTAEPSGFTRFDLAAQDVERDSGIFFGWSPYGWADGAVRFARAREAFDARQRAAYQALMYAEGARQAMENRMPREWEAPAEDDATLDAREHGADREDYRREQAAELADEERRLAGGAP